MDRAFELRRQDAVDEALAIDTGFARERGRGDLDTEMGLAFRPRAHMARMLVRFVDDIEAGG